MYMRSFPIQYHEPLFRPPSEANSLILQVTLGCSWNRCTFCEMYTSKSFRPRPFAEIDAEIKAVARRYRGIRKVFLADGNALVLSNRRLLPILASIRRELPDVERISSYAMPADVLRKSDDELRELVEAGLTLIYVGVESGNDEVLRRVQKGQTQAESIEALQRAGRVGLRRSVMILNGLGGTTLLEQHAIDSAHVLNETQPEFAATLVVSFPLGDQRFRASFGPDWRLPDQRQLFEEVALLLANCQLERTEFRSNHASNYLVLKGTLNRDRDRLLAQVRRAIEAPDQVPLRPEWARGL